MRKRRLRGVGLGAILLLAVAACGDDSGTTSDTTAGGGGPDTTAAPNPDFEGLAFDESDQCGVDPYMGNFAKMEAVDELTVRFTLCNPDVAFPSKVAFTSFGIFPDEYLESTGGGGDLVEAPIGTGPYQLDTWDRGNQIVWTAFEDYWGEPANADTLVFKWSAESAQRLVELQSGTVDGIDNVGTEDFETVAGRLEPPADRARPAQRLLRRLQRRHAAVRQRAGPPGHCAGHRQAAARRQLLPAGSVVADAVPPRRDPRLTSSLDRGRSCDVEAAQALLAEAGFADGIDVTLSYRDVVRGYLPQPAPVATDLQDQLAEIGIRVTLDPQESTTFIDNANAGTLPFYLLGWGADYPDATNFLDYHFGAGASPQFGDGLPRHPRAASARPRS